MAINLSPTSVREKYFNDRIARTAVRDFFFDIRNPLANHFNSRHYGNGSSISNSSSSSSYNGGGSGKRLVCDRVVNLRAMVMFCRPSDD